MVQTIKGKIIKILNTSTIVIDKGNKDGIKQGMKLIIYTEGPMITNDIGEEIEPLELVKATTTVTSVQDKLSIARSEVIRSSPLLESLSRDPFTFYTHAEIAKPESEEEILEFTPEKVKVGDLFRVKYEPKTDYEDLRKSPSIYYLNRQLELMENREDPLERQEILGNFRHHIHMALEPPISDERIEILFKILEMINNWIREPDLRSTCLDILSFRNFERVSFLAIKWKELLPIIKELKAESWNELSLLEKKRLLIILLRMRKGEYDFLKVLAESAIKEWSEEEFPTLKDVFDFTELVRDFPEDIKKLDKTLRDLRVTVKKDNDQPEIPLQRATYLIKKIDEAFQFLY